MKPSTRKSKRPAPPPDLGPEAELEWQRVCDELEAADALATVDRALLTVYVNAWGTYCQAMAHVAKHGPVVMHHNKTVGASPFYEVARQQAAEIRRLLAELRLTPATRVVGDDTADPLSLDD